MTDSRQGACVDDRSAQLCELTFREVGKRAIQGIGDDKPEDRVAQEFEALIRGQTTVLVRVRAVGQRPFEQGIVKTDPEALNERIDRRHADQTSMT